MKGGRKVDGVGGQVIDGGQSFDLVISLLFIAKNGKIK